MVKVYSKENCPQCRLTKNLMKDRGVKFIELDVETDEAALNHMKSLGFSSLPFVETSETNWTGFRPDMIKELAN